jgi:hypothetical protein
MSYTRIPVYFVWPAEHYVLPLALGMLRAFAKAFDGGALARRLDLVPLWPIASTASARRTAPGIWLFSDYFWTTQRNLQTSRAVKEADPRNVIIHGGPDVPGYPDALERFFASHPHVDVAIHGEGERTLADVLEHLCESWGAASDWRAGLEGIHGLSFIGVRDRVREVIRTPARARLTDLDELPSPFLDGTFDRWLTPNMRLVTVETNRGCPHGCTFCDWGSATRQKIRKFDLERVKEEIAWGARNQLLILFIADANFGIFDRDVEIAEHVGEMRRRYGFPHEVQVSYAKNGNPRIAEIVRAMVSAGVCTQGIISIQSTDPNTLRVIRRSNIRTENYRTLAQTFREHRLPISTDLMVGLPGATLQAHLNDVQFFFDEDIPVKFYLTKVPPNSPMAAPEYLEKHQIRVNDGEIIIATATASEADIQEIRELVPIYELAEKATLLRYVLRYVQWEHGVSAIEFLRRLRQELAAHPEEFPAYLANPSSQSSMMGVREDPEPFYQSIEKFAREVMKLPVDTEAAQTVWALNAGIIPRRGRRYPIVVESRYDLVGHFRDCVTSGPDHRRHLVPTDELHRFEIGDPRGLAEMDFERLWLFNNYQRYFELEWPAKRVIGAAEFHEGLL